jgi:pyruvate-formate lyase-activating enzyme
MILNARNTLTRCLLSLARTDLLFYPYYRYHLPLPSQILIENTNCCNARCVMCPRETLTRERGFMAFDLFEKIIREIASARRTPVVHLHGFGEPLLDESLPERIMLAKSCGIRRTYLVTNASLLFPEMSRRIVNAGLDTMKVSFYGTDEESYQAAMKRLDFGAAVHNIKEFVKIRKDLGKTTPRLILQYLPQEANHAKVKEFHSLWRSVLDKRAGDRLTCSTLHNYGGGRVYNRIGKRIVSVCFYPWTALSVLWDGRAVTCCMDYDGVQGVGDLNSQTVKEIWNGPELSAIRSDFGKMDYSGYPTCLCCDWVCRR